MKKMTYVQALEIALSTMTNEEAKERINALIESLNKRNASKVGALTKTQQENEDIKQKMLEVLAERPEGVKASDMVKEFDLPSSQKASALLNQLVDEHKLIKEKVKGVQLFKLA